MTSRRRGFTFVELLAAMLFMAIVIPVAVEGVQLANRVSQRAVMKRRAVELADQVLNNLIVTGTWLDGDSSGDFGNDAPGFSWNSTTEDWAEDSTMSLVTVSVTYTSQGVSFSESVSTLAYESTAESDT